MAYIGGVTVCKKTENAVEGFFVAATFLVFYFLYCQHQQV